MSEKTTIELPGAVLPGADFHEVALRLPSVEYSAIRVDLDPLMVERLIASARLAAERAYAPYSKFRVGAAVVMSDDDRDDGMGVIFTGCNVENAAYGETVCAERNAIHSAIAAGYRKIRLLALSTIDSLDGPTRDRSPCGSCRQVIREFATDETLILIDGAEAVEVLDIERLLPFGFRLG